MPRRTSRNARSAVPRTNLTAEDPPVGTVEMTHSSTNGSGGNASQMVAVNNAPTVTAVAMGTDGNSIVYRYKHYPEFSGKPGESAENFLREFSNLADNENFSDELKTKILLSRLRGFASNVKNFLAPNATFMDARNTILQYHGISYEEATRRLRDARNFSQDANIPVSQYLMMKWDKFLMANALGRMTEKEIVSEIIFGMRQPLRSILERKEITAFTALNAAAMELEMLYPPVPTVSTPSSSADLENKIVALMQQMEERLSKTVTANSVLNVERDTSQLNSWKRSNEQFIARETQKRMDKRNLNCFACGKPGHKARDCWDRKSRDPRDKNPYVMKRTPHQDARPATAPYPRNRTWPRPSNSQHQTQQSNNSFSRVYNVNNAD